jgi:hypothetical protein
MCVCVCACVLVCIQVGDAVVGEDAAGLETDLLRMSTRLIAPGAALGPLSPPAAAGAAVPRFSLPDGALAGGAGAGESLTVQVTGERGVF